MSGRGSTSATAHREGRSTSGGADTTKNNYPAPPVLSTAATIAEEFNLSASDRSLLETVSEYYGRANTNMLQAEQYNLQAATIERTVGENAESKQLRVNASVAIDRAKSAVQAANAVGRYLDVSSRGWTKIKKRLKEFYPMTP